MLTPPRCLFARTLGRVVPLLIASVVFSGCVSSKYKLTQGKPTPPVIINLAAAQMPAEAIVHSVIIYQGPGSWKREAYWDEYVVSVSNRGDTPLRIEQAELIDGDSNVVRAGEDPWALDKESRSWWKEVQASQTSTLVALGAGAAVAGVIATSSLATLNATVVLSTVGVTSNFGAVTAGAAVAAIALPVYAVTIVTINHRNKAQVAAEFNRRRLALPETLPPGASRSGSLFLRVTPSPRRLVLRGQAGGQPWELSVDLAPLAGLHKKTPAGAAPPEK